MLGVLTKRGTTMQIKFHLNQEVIKEFAEENNVSYEAVINDLLYYFHLLQDDKDYFKKEILDRKFQ
jgi:hypothetical protein